MTLRAVDGSSIVALGLLLVAGCARGPETGFVPQESSTGHLEISATRDSRTYSFRSDPDTEFITKSSHGGMAWRRNKTIVFSDGRYSLTYFTYQGDPVEIYETNLTEQDMATLLSLIVDSGLMDHDHRKAKVAQRRNPMEGRRFINCSDCSSFSLTIKLAEDNCPDRGPKAPITAAISAYPMGLRLHKDVPELVGAVTLSRALEEFRKRSRQTRPK